jgi:hypothetical protein
MERTSQTDFGFFVPSTVSNPGTGTPGYWKNHPEAWPSPTITIGGNIYTIQKAIEWMQKPDNKDKTLTIFSSLVSAKLNVAIGNDPACVGGIIDLADGWMATHPVGSVVAAASAAWKVAEPWHRHMDNYNNGMLCVQHRD